MCSYGVGQGGASGVGYGESTQVCVVMHTVSGCLSFFSSAHPTHLAVDETVFENHLSTIET